LVLNVPLIDHAPGSGGKAALIANVATYNSILSNYTSAFAANHTDSNVFYFDTYAYLKTILDDASSYGFKNITSFCPRYDAPDFNTNYAAYGCLAPYEYFWFNSGHITYPVHKLMAEKIFDMLNTGGTV
jgi:phospholipase/lecithinase/hemolysin